MAKEKEKSEHDQELDHAADAAGEEDANAERILGLRLTVNVNLDKLTMSLREILNLTPGAVIELNKMVDEPLDVVVSNTKKVAKGEVVTIGENLGIRVVETEQ